MFKALFFIVATAAAAYTFTDLESDSAFLSIVLPVVFVLSLIAFALWVALFINRNGLDKQEGIQKVENNAPVSPDDMGGFGGGDGGV
jgi:hypothetical protein